MHYHGGLGFLGSSGPTSLSRTRSSSTSSSSRGSQSDLALGLSGFDFRRLLARDGARETIHTHGSHLDSPGLADEIAEDDSLLPPYPPVGTPLLDLLQKLQHAGHNVRRKELRCRRKLREENDELKRTLSEALDRMKGLDTQLRERRERIKHLEHDSGSNSEELVRLRRENASLRHENQGLLEVNNRLREDHRDMQRVVEDFECKAPMVVLKQHSPPERCVWRIDDAQHERRCHPRPACLSSPQLGIEKLGVRPIEFEFYPNGSSDAPRHFCSLCVRCPRGSRLTFQLFVGQQRTEPLEVVFTSQVREYIRHFSNMLGEVSPIDGSLTVGMELIRNHRTAKYILS